jgi:ankyrin repeat protein
MPEIFIKQGGSCHVGYIKATSHHLHAAALGHLDVLKAVVEALQSSAADVAGCQGSENIKEPSINMLTWGRFVKDVMNARTSAGKTPLMLACEKGYATALPVCGDVSCMQWPSRRRQGPFSVLITSNSNCQSSSGIVGPLIRPISCRHADCAAYLLEQGADAFAVDKAHRRSAIHYAVLGPQPDALRMLLSDDAKIHTEDGRMPLRDVRVHDMSGQCRWRSIVHRPVACYQLHGMCFPLGST